MVPAIVAPLWAGLTRSGGSTLGRDWVRPAPTRAQQQFDVAMVFVLLPVFWLRFQLTISAGLWQESDRAAFEAMVWSGVLSLAFMVRRRYPLATLSYALVAVSIAVVINPESVSTFPLDFFLYGFIFTAAAWGQSRRRTTIALLVVLVVQVSSLVVRVLSPRILARVDAVVDPVGDLPSRFSNSLYMVGITLTYTAGAWIIGTIAWRGARQREELRIQTAELKQAQEENARQAVVADRVRIARELHDVVAHHVSIIGIQASAARRTMVKDPGAAGQALVEVETSSRQAVGEMRTLLGALRSEDDSGHPVRTGPVDTFDIRDPTLAPLPGLADLPNLVQKVNASGLATQFTVLGEPFPVPRSVGLSLYRTAQEALANVRRHSTTPAAHVTVRYRERESVEIDVQDIGNPSGAPHGTGLGHRGMRERAALHSGEVEIGPMPTGGFRVRMTLPVDKAPDEVVSRAGASLHRSSL